VSPATKGQGRPGPPPLTISSINSAISSASTAPGGIGSTIRAPARGTVGAVGSAIRTQGPSSNAAGAVGTMMMRPGMGQPGQQASPRQQQQQETPAGYSPRALAEYSTSAVTSVASSAYAMQQQQQQQQQQYGGQQCGGPAGGAGGYDANSIIEVARQQYAPDSRGNTYGGGY
jgi:hypothetical protein